MKVMLPKSAKMTAFHGVAIVLGLFFAFAGSRKLFTDWEEAKLSYLQHHPLWVYYASGVIELICGLGIVFPRTRFACSICLLIMIVLVAIHPYPGGPGALKFLIPAVVSTLILVGVAWGSRPR